MFKRRPKYAPIALSLKLVTMLPALIHQLGINVTAIRSMGPCEIQARHVVFGRACGAALTTLSNLENTVEIDEVTILTLEQETSRTHVKLTTYTHETLR